MTPDVVNGLEANRGQTSGLYIPLPGLNRLTAKAPLSLKQCNVGLGVMETREV